MLQRCENPNDSSYHLYGGRGIKVCDEWHDYATFKEWALSNGYDESLSIDRIDVNGNYEPANCRYADAKEQARNRRPDWHRGRWKPVVALDSDGSVVREFRSVREAMSWLGLGENSNAIYRAARSGKGTAYGYRWRYVNA